MAAEATIVIEDMSSIQADDKKDSNSSLEAAAAGPVVPPSIADATPPRAKKTAQATVSKAAVRRRDLYAPATASSHQAPSKARSEAAREGSVARAAAAADAPSDEPAGRAPPPATNAAEQSTQIYTDEPPPKAAPSTETSPGTKEEPDTALVSLLTRASETIKSERAQNAALSARVASLEAWLGSLVAHCHADWLGRASGAHEAAPAGDALREWLFAEAASWSRELHLSYDFTQRHRSHSAGAAAPASQPRRASREASAGAAARSPRHSYAAQAARGRSFPFITARDSAALTGQTATPTNTAAVKDDMSHNTAGRRAAERHTPRAASPTPAGPTHVACGPVAHAAQQSAAATRSDTNVVSMLTRLRRALAPPPSREQIGDVIEAMVSALQEDVQRRLQTADGGTGRNTNGDAAPSQHARQAANTEAEPVSCLFIRRGPTEYELLIGTAAALSEARRSRRHNAQPSKHADAAATGQQLSSIPSSARKAQRDAAASLARYRLHLSIDSGQLCVAVGGGHVNIFDYLERKLRRKL